MTGFATGTASPTPSSTGSTTCETVFDGGCGAAGTGVGAGAGGGVDCCGGEVVPLNNLAWLLTLQGVKGPAPLDMINRAIHLRGPVPEFLDTRAVVYLTNGESRRAIEDLENAVAVDPTASRYFHLARAYLEAGDMEAAKRSLVRARDRGLSVADVHPLERSALAHVEKALK